MNTLSIGSSGPAVQRLQELLAAQGFYAGKIDGDFGAQTEHAVVQFQFSHIGPDKKQLQGDGEVGPATLWALNNPSGPAQRSGIISEIPSGLAEPRRKILGIALREHKAGTREIPDGSNRGDGVDKIISGFGPAPWCALFVSYCTKEATGEYPLGVRQAHVATYWERAKKAGFAHKVGTYKPVPGDAFVFVHANGTGHIGFVLAVEESSPNTDFNTLEGNCGNRVKCGLRSPKERDFAGFINIHGESSPGHSIGLLNSAQRVGGEGTR